MPKKILVVDDSLLLHKVYEVTLKSYQGCELEVHFATNGHEGLKRLHEHPDTAVVFLDVNMPTMSGLEFLKQVRGEEAFAGLPVILQSTEDHQSDIDRGIEAGANGYLTKPFTPAQLHEKLDSLLRGSAASAGDG